MTGRKYLLPDLSWVKSLKGFLFAVSLLLSWAFHSL